MTLTFFRRYLLHPAGLLVPVVALGIGLPGCVEEPDDDDTTTDDDDSIFDDDDDSSEGPTPCDPALTLSASPASAVPYALLSLSATGGTGEYRYVLSPAPAPSGAALNEFTGSYLAGPTAGVVDSVVLTDLGCVGSASLDIDVYEPMEVLPEAGSVPLGASFDFEMLGGSGTFTCESLQTFSGGDVTPGCTYTAGLTDGLDGIRVTDSGTEESADVWLEVVSGLVLRPEPPSLAIPVGSSFALSVHGGTDTWDATPSGTSAELVDGVFYGLEEGVTVMGLVDRFTGLSTEVEVDVVVSQGLSTVRAGDLTITGMLLAAGDVNSDGHPDVLFGWGESDLEGVNGGAVSLWYGSAAGLGPVPAQTFGSDGREDQAGRGLGVGDFNDDGEVDLVIGVPLRDTSSASEGLARVYYGIAGAGFSTVPDVEMEAPFNGDRLGEAVAGCDFNGDGIDDLAVGSVRAEDRTQSPQSSNQGAVHIYEGTAAGLEDTPDYSIYGKKPSATGWAGENNIYLGWRLAAGDIDADGYCDLVVGSYEHSSNDGIVFLYLGSAEGLLEDPEQSWAIGLDGSGSEHFGRRLAVGDVNADGYEDILVSARTLDVGGTNRGGAFLFLGEDFSSNPVPTEVTDAFADADWMMLGQQNSDLDGHSVDFGDLDGDGLVDILVGGPATDHSPNYNDGSVKVFLGQVQSPSNPTGLPELTPSLTYLGLASADYFGQLVAFVGDVEGDGSADFVSLAGRADDFGFSAGVPYQISYDPSVPWRALEHAGGIAGQWLGWAADFVGDFDFDGYVDLAVGAPRADYSDLNSNGGSVSLYRGSATGFSAVPDWTLEGFYGHSNLDEFGYGVAPAGDFTGDGKDDLVVIARSDSRPGNLSSTWIANPEPPGCEAASAYAVGRASVFAGLDGLPADPATILQPTTIYYGPGGNLHTVDGGFDFNGDGYSDFVVGAARYDGRPCSDGFDNDGDGQIDYPADTGCSSATDKTEQLGAEAPDNPASKTDNGSVQVVFGRPPDGSGKTYVVCEPDWKFEGIGDGNEIGRSLTVMGDIDGDGCDEFAAGAPEADFDNLSNQGAVHVLFGFDDSGSCNCAAPVTGLCNETARMVTMVPEDSGAWAGWSLDYGPDVDGDGLSDLAVGGYNLPVLNDNVGAGWVVPGSYLETLTPEVADWQIPDTRHALNTEPGSWRVEGRRDGERVGRSVALVPPYGSAALGGLLVGGPRGGDSGVGLSGGARLHLFDPSEVSGDDDDDLMGGLGDIAAFSMGGETSRPGSELGEWVRSGVLDGRVYALVGGYGGGGVGLDAGSLYVVELGDEAP